MVKVIASKPRPTTTGVDRGVDVDVTVTMLDGHKVDGEVTLLPREDGTPTYDSWGSTDNWLGGALLAELYAQREAAEDRRAAWDDYLDAIRDAASRAAGPVLP